MAAEIAEQPAALARLLAAAGEVREVAAAVSRRRPRFVLLAARGSSDHAALYAKYLAEIRLALPAGLASPSVTTLYGARQDLADVLFVAVSQSGGSPDLVDSTDAARRSGALTVAVTNDPGSPLAGVAELVVPLHAGEERAVAATKTYTAELLALYLLLGGPDAPRRAAALPDAARRALDESPAAGADRYRYADRLIIVGRGYSYPTAREGALKLMETSYLAAQAFSAADLAHGPVAMADAAVPVIAVVPGGPAAASVGELVARLRAGGTDVLTLRAADGVADELRPVLEILPLQRLAWKLALDRGGDPDRPRGLAKVTRTR
ncbi:SIS domain-containing protein [Pilimelia anulata]|nr:SIS domain-containing protein [Pilimelia anulata]